MVSLQPIHLQKEHGRFLALSAVTSYFCRNYTSRHNGFLLSCTHDVRLLSFSCPGICWGAQSQTNEDESGVG